MNCTNCNATIPEGSSRCPNCEAKQSRLETQTKVVTLQVGDQIHELNRKSVSIGRNDDNHIVLVDESVSGHHAEIIAAEGQYFIRDLGSTNGTRLNGQPITKTQLNAGDTICFGGVEASFSIASLPTQETAAVDKPEMQTAESPTLEAEKPGPSIGSKMAVLGNSAWEATKRKARLISLKTQIEKLRRIDLRKAHQALGRKCFELKTCKEIFSGRFQEISTLESRVEGCRKSVYSEDGAKALDKVRVLAKNQAGKLTGEALSLQFSGLFVELGKAAAELKEDSIMPEQELRVVRAVEKRISELEILSAAVKSFSTDCVNNSNPRLSKLFVVGAVLVVLILFVLLKQKESSTLTYTKEEELDRGNGVPSESSFIVTFNRGVLGTPANLREMEASKILNAIVLILKNTYPEIRVSVHPDGTCYFHLGSDGEKKNHLFRCYMPKMDPYRVFETTEKNGNTIDVGVRVIDASYERWVIAGNKYASRNAPLILRVSANTKLRELLRQLVSIYYDLNEDEPKDSNVKHSVVGNKISAGLGLTASNVLEQLYTSNTYYYWVRRARDQEERLLSLPFNPTVYLCGPRDDLIAVDLLSFINLKSPKQNIESQVRRHIEITNAVDSGLALWSKIQLQAAISSGESFFGKRYQASPQTYYAFNYEDHQGRVLIKTAIFGVKEVEARDLSKVKLPGDSSVNDKSPSASAVIDDKDGAKSLFGIHVADLKSLFPGLEGPVSDPDGKEVYRVTENDHFPTSVFLEKGAISQIMIDRPRHLDESFLKNIRDLLGKGHAWTKHQSKLEVVSQMGGCTWIRNDGMLEMHILSNNNQEGAGIVVRKCDDVSRDQ